MRFLTIKQLYLPKLFICYTHNSNLPKLWKERFNSFYMHCCIFATGTMSNIDRKLKHCKTIMLQIFPKIGISFLIFFRFRRQIKKNQYPHHTIFTKTVH